MSKFQQEPDGLAMAEPERITNQEIGSRIRALRKQKGFSQSRLAQAIGVTFQQVQKYESGKNRLSVSTLLAISAVLQCPIQTVLGTNELDGLSNTERDVLRCWRTLPSDKHRDVIQTLMGWL